MKTFKEYITEDGEGGAPTNSVGGGAIAGTGSGPNKKSAEPPGRKSVIKNMFRRKTVEFI